MSTPPGSEATEPTPGAPPDAAGWAPVLPGLWLWRDSCNVYALEAAGGTIFVDAGTGHWVPSALERFPPPHVLLCTHYLRDHAAGARAAADAGMAVLVPDAEEEIFADPAEHLRQRPSYLVYDNVWDTFVPIEGVPVAGVLRDLERLELLGTPVEVLPLPGATPGQIGIATDLPGTGPVVFCGEAVHAGGRVARVAPLQYGYNDLGGVVDVAWSGRLLADRAPRAVLPSLGDPVLEDVAGTLDGLAATVRGLCANRPGERALVEGLAEDGLEQVTDHLWRSTRSNASSWFVVSASGRILAIDYGYHAPGGTRFTPGAAASQWPAYGSRARTRALPHSLEGLRTRLGAERIDIVLLTHYHDDHVAGVPLLRRLQGTACWAPDTFADLVARPDAHAFPCTWPGPVVVDRVLPAGEPFRWEEHEFRMAPMSGHTRFSTAFGFEVDGLRVAHVGDQYVLVTPEPDPRAPVPGEWADSVVIDNHVYRNGCTVSAYADSAALLSAWRPDLVLTGHLPPLWTDDAFFARIARHGDDFAALHRRSMPIGPEDAHFDADSRGGWIWPYRTHLPAPAPVDVRVAVRNPLPREAALELVLVGPRGWSGSRRTVHAEGRAEVTAALTITPAGRGRRQPFALELLVDGRSFGQVAEALLTVGGDAF